MKTSGAVSPFPHPLGRLVVVYSTRKRCQESNLLVVWKEPLGNELRYQKLDVPRLEMFSLHTWICYYHYITFPKVNRCSYNW